MIESKNKSRILRRYSLDFLNNKSKIHKVFIESHRGVNREEPENTLSAFEKAIQLECDSIEMDIWLTKDKIPIVIHGDDEGNIDEYYGKIKSHDYETISKINLGKGEKIPKLEEVLRICKNKIFLNLELKDPNHQETTHEVFKLVSEYNMHDEVQISSFKFGYWDSLKEKSIDSQIEFGFLYERSIDKKLEVEFHNKRSTINLWYKDVNYDIVQKAHQNNIGVLAWFCLEDEETDDVINNLIDFRVDIICTNDPRRALRIRENFYQTNIKILECE